MGLSLLAQTAAQNKSCSATNKTNHSAYLRFRYAEVAKGKFCKAKPQAYAVGQGFASKPSFHPFCI